MIEVKGTCINDLNTKFGTWYLLCTISKVSGTVDVVNVDVISHDSSAGLAASDINVTQNTGNLDITVRGINSQNYTWNTEYKIIMKSSN